jgi:hypothetical protein
VKFDDLISQGVPIELLRPLRFHSGADVMRRSSSVPRLPGVYAWFFDELPGAIDASECHSFDGKKLLYVGISPSAPPSSGKGLSRSQLNRGSERISEAMLLVRPSASPWGAF